MTPSIPRATGRRLVALVATVGLFSAACSSASDNAVEESTMDTTASGELQLTYVQEPPSDPVPGGELAFGLNAETDGWDVTTNRWSGSAYIVGGALFDPLVALGADGRPHPYLAESIEPSDDFLLWTIKLRPGVTFHDGTAVNAEAVARNLEAHQASILTSASMEFVADDGITAVDDLTVEVRMDTPWATFPDLLTGQPGYVMAPSMMDDPDGSRNPVGSGPFEFESWVPNQDLRANKNTDYWRDGLPYLESVQFQVLVDVQTRGRALETGQIDAMETGDANQIRSFAQDAREGKVQMFSDDNLENAETFIALNTTQPPFDDPLARQILAYGVDTQGLSDAAYGGLFPPARGMFAESSPWYAETEYPAYDLARATELHEQWKAEHGGQPLAFTANITPTPEIQAIAQTLQQQALQAGVEVSLNSIDQATLIADAVSRNYEATGFILFGSALPDRESVFFADIPEGSFLNITGNANPAIIEAVTALRATDDPELQAEQWAIIQQEQAKDLNFIWLVHNLSAVVFTNSVFGFVDTTLPDGSEAANSVTPFLTEVWVSR